MKAGCILAFCLIRVTAMYFSWPSFQSHLLVGTASPTRHLPSPWVAQVRLSLSLHLITFTGPSSHLSHYLVTYSPHSSRHYHLSPHHNPTSTPHNLFALAFARSPTWSDSCDLIKNGGSCISGTPPRLTRLQKRATPECRTCSLTSN